MKFGHGLVIGKFLPPHRGHGLLINTACSCCDRVTVIVCAKDTDPIPGEQRARWIQEIHPQAHVMLIDDHYDPDDSQVWAENTIRWLGHAPDAVFTSEDYGETYTRIMGCRHVMVDRSRQAVPCSGTAIRNDPFGNWNYIEPPVRAWYARRVCILGAESTGTTTLAQALAKRFETVWVPEYGREYCESKFRDREIVWTADEFAHIAAEQKAREESAARQSNRLLICDTNAFATRLWERRYLGQESDAVRAEAAKVRCDLYILTGDEIPFVQDGLRDGELIRHAMHTWFEKELQAQPVPWILVRGTPQERLAAASESIHQLFGQSLCLNGE
jgi:NadR type nicotinamide-nucleotide adenylyltransferase